MYAYVWHLLLVVCDEGVAFVFCRCIGECAYSRPTQLVVFAQQEVSWPGKTFPSLKPKFPCQHCQDGCASLAWLLSVQGKYHQTHRIERPFL